MVKNPPSNAGEAGSTLVGKLRSHSLGSIKPECYIEEPKSMKTQHSQKKKKKNETNKQKKTKTKKQKEISSYILPRDTAFETLSSLGDPWISSGSAKQADLLSHPPSPDSQGLSDTWAAILTLLTFSSVEWERQRG